MYLLRPPLQIIMLLPLTISLANTYGLAITVLLLGYGTAEFPRALQRRAYPAAEQARRAMGRGEVVSGNHTLHPCLSACLPAAPRLLRGARGRERPL